MKTFAIGDRVMFTKKFLQSIGAITGDLPFAVGTITSEVKDYGNGMKVQKVLWDGDEEPKSVRISNIIKKADLHKELH